MVIGATLGCHEVIDDKQDDSASRKVSSPDVVRVDPDDFTGMPPIFGEVEGVVSAVSAIHSKIERLLRADESTADSQILQVLLLRNGDYEVRTRYAEAKDQGQYVLLGTNDGGGLYIKDIAFWQA